VKVSVVVITRDRVDSLERCIGSIMANRREELQLVILDNGSNRSHEKLRPFLDELRGSVELVYARSAPAGFAELRRKAVAMADGEIIFSIDDDCVAEESAINRIVERFESDDSVGIVGGAIENVGFEGADRFKGRGVLGINGRYEPVEDPARAEIFGSANKSMRREAYERAGGYDPFFSAGMEEADLTLSIRRLGYGVVHEPAARITHHHLPGRYRSLWSNLEVMRLYLFFKHFRPRGGEEWRLFAGREWRLLVGDLLGVSISRRVKALSAAGRRGPGLYLRALALVKIDLLKFLWARLSIPYLALRARARGAT
jgi:GT2 family glycosyltransferase